MGGSGSKSYINNTEISRLLNGIGGGDVIGEPSGYESTTTSISHIHPSNVTKLGYYQLTYNINRLPSNYGYKSMILPTKSPDYLSIRLYNAFSSCPYSSCNIGDNSRFKMTVSYNDKFASNNVKCGSIGKPYAILNHYLNDTLYAAETFTPNNVLNHLIPTYPGYATQLVTYFQLVTNERMSQLTYDQQENDDNVDISYNYTTKPKYSEQWRDGNSNDVVSDNAELFLNRYWYDGFIDLIKCTIENPNPTNIAYTRKILKKVVYNSDGTGTYTYRDTTTTVNRSTYKYGISDISKNVTLVYYGDSHYYSHHLNHQSPEVFIKKFNDMKEAPDIFLHVPTSVFIDNTNWRPLPSLQDELYNWDTFNVYKMECGAPVINDGNYVLAGSLSNLSRVNFGGSINYKIDTNYVIGNVLLPVTTEYVAVNDTLPYSPMYELRDENLPVYANDSTPADKIDEVNDKMGDRFQSRIDFVTNTYKECIDYESQIYNIPSRIDAGNATDEDFNMKQLARYSLNIGSFYQNSADLSTCFPLLWIRDYNVDDVHAYNFIGKDDTIPQDRALFNQDICNQISILSRGNFHRVSTGLRTTIKQEYTFYPSNSQPGDYMRRICMEGSNKNNAYSEVSTRGEFDTNFLDAIKYINLKSFLGYTSMLKFIYDANTDFYIKYIHRYGALFNGASINEGQVNYELGEDLSATELFYTKIDEPTPPDILSISTELNVGQKVCIGWDLYGIPDESLEITNCRNVFDTTMMYLFKSDCTIGYGDNEYIDFMTKLKPVSVIFKDNNVSNFNSFRPNMARFNHLGLFHNRVPWNYDSVYLNIFDSSFQSNSREYGYIYDPLVDYPQLCKSIKDENPNTNCSEFGIVIPTMVKDFITRNNVKLRISTPAFDAAWIIIPDNILVNTLLTPKIQYTLFPGNFICNIYMHDGSDSTYSSEIYCRSITVRSLNINFDSNWFKSLLSESLTRDDKEYLYSLYSYIFLSKYNLRLVLQPSVYIKLDNDDNGKVIQKRARLVTDTIIPFCDVPISSFVANSWETMTIFDELFLWRTRSQEIHGNVDIVVPYANRDVCRLMQNNSHSTYYGEYYKFNDNGTVVIYNGLREDTTIKVGSRIMDYACTQIPRHEYIAVLRQRFGELYIDECKEQDIVINNAVRAEYVKVNICDNLTNSLQVMVNDVKSSLAYSADLCAQTVASQLNTISTTSCILSYGHGIVNFRDTINITSYNAPTMTSVNSSDDIVSTIIGMVNKVNTVYPAGVLFKYATEQKYGTSEEVVLERYRHDYFLDFHLDTDNYARILNPCFDISSNNYDPKLDDFEFSVRSYPVYAVNRIVDVDKTSVANDIVYTLEKPIIACYNEIKLINGKVRVYEKMRYTNKIFASKMLNAYLVGRRQEIFPSIRHTIYTDDGEIRLNNTYLPIWYDQCELNFRHEVNSTRQPDPWINYIENYTNYELTVTVNKNNPSEYILIDSNGSDVKHVNAEELAKEYRVDSNTVVLSKNKSVYLDTLKTSFLRTSGRPAIRPRGIYTDPNVAILFDAPTKNFLHFDDHLVSPIDLASYETIGDGKSYHHPYFTPETFVNCSYCMYFKDVIPKQASQIIDFDVSSPKALFNTVRTIFTTGNYLMFEIFLNTYQNIFVENCVGLSQGTYDEINFNNLLYASHQYSLDGHTYTTLGILEYLDLFTVDLIKSFDMRIMIIFIMWETIMTISTANMPGFLKIFQKYCLITKVPVTQLQLMLTAASCLTYNDGSACLSVHNKVCSGMNIARFRTSTDANELNVPSNKADELANAYGYTKVDNGYEEITGPFEILAGSPIAYMERIAISTAIDYFKGELIDRNVKFLPDVTVQNQVAADKKKLNNNQTLITLNVKTTKRRGYINMPMYDRDKLTKFKTLTDFSGTSDYITCTHDIYERDYKGVSQFPPSIIKPKRLISFSNHTYSNILNSIINYPIYDIHFMDDVFLSFNNLPMYSLFRSVGGHVNTQDIGTIVYKYNIRKLSKPFCTHYVDLNRSSTMIESLSISQNIVDRDYNTINVKGITDDHNNIPTCQLHIAGFASYSESVVAFENVVDMFIIFREYLSIYNKNVMRTTQPFSTFFDNLSNVITVAQAWDYMQSSNSSSIKNLVK